MPDLITTDLVALDADLGADKSDVIRRLAELVADAGRATDADGLLADAMAREAQARHRAARRHRHPALPLGRRSPRPRSPSPGCRPTVDFGAPDGPADLVFLIAAPAHGDADHLKLLTALARALVRPDFVASLRAAASAEEVVALVEDVVSPAPAAAAAARAPRPPPAAATAAPSRERSIVAVTACPTGIAHTYMAADKLAAAGEDAGVDVARRDAGLVGRHAAAPGASSAPPTRSSSPSTSASGTRAGSPASRSIAVRRQAGDQRARRR